MEGRDGSGAERAALPPPRRCGVPAALVRRPPTHSPCLSLAGLSVLAQEPHGAAPVDFLQELPSYQSARRRRGGTQERTPTLLGTAGSRGAAARALRQEKGELADRPAREQPKCMAEKRRARLIFTRFFLGLIFFFPMTFLNINPGALEG